MKQGETKTFDFRKNMDPKPFETDEFLQLLTKFKTSDVHNVLECVKAIKDYCQKKLDLAVAESKNKLLGDEIRYIKKRLKEIEKD